MEANFSSGATAFLTQARRLLVANEARYGLINSIVEVKWFDLRSEESWDNDMVLDPFTYPLLQRVRKSLGYLARDSDH